MTPDTSYRGTVVGRGRLRAMVHDMLRDGSSVLLDGEAGVGKSRLAGSVLAEPRLGGRLVARLQATEATSTTQLATLASAAPLPPRTSPTEVYAVVLDRWSRAAAGSPPPLVLVEDAHHVDPMTAAFLRIAIEAGSLQLLAARRTPHPLPAPLQSLLTSGHVRPVAVDPLPDDAIRRVAQQTLPTPPSPAVVERVVSLAQGNPLYARELTRALGRGADPPLQEALEALVGRAVLDRPAAERRVLEIVAVAEPMPLDLLADHRDAVSSLRRDGLLVVDEARRVRLDHPLRRQWLQTDLGPGGPRLLGRFLDDVGAEAVRSLAPGRYLEWCQLTGRPVVADDVELAAESALARGDAATALRLLRSLPADQGRAVRAQALVADGQVAAGLRELDLHLATDGPTPELAMWCVRYFAIGAGQIERAEEIIQGLEQRGGAEASVAAVRCRVWLANFRALRPQAPLERWTEVADGVHDPTLQAEMRAGIAATMLLRDGPDAGAALAAASLRRVGVDPWTPAHGRCASAAVMRGLAAGDFAPQLTLIEQTLDAARRHHDIESALWMAGAGGLLLAIAGRVRRAVEVARPFRWIDDEHRWFGFGEMSALSLAGARAYLGVLPDPDLLARTRSGPGATPMLSCRAADLAAGLRGEGHDETALLTGFEVSATRGHRLYVAVLAAETVDSGAADEVHQAVLEVLDPLAGGLVSLAVDSARARLDRDPSTLLVLAEHAERAGWVAPALRLLGDVLRLDDEQPGHGLAPRARLGMLRLLRRWDGDDPWFLPPAPTPRQREIGWLVARHGSTRDVAAELGLSVRTVDNHLQRLFDFVGLHDRRALADALHPERPPGGP